jgi:drug/metabolite transporter (DMT)-like permease
MGSRYQKKGPLKLASAAGGGVLVFIGVLLFIAYYLTEQGCIRARFLVCQSFYGELFLGVVSLTLGMILLLYGMSNPGISPTKIEREAS